MNPEPVGLIQTLVIDVSTVAILVEANNIERTATNGRRDILPCVELELIEQKIDAVISGGKQEGLHHGTP